MLQVTSRVLADGRPFSPVNPPACNQHLRQLPRCNATRCGPPLPALPGIIGVKQTGRLAVATTNAFDASLARAYEAAGIRVQAIENMTLEEIFVTNVHYSREGVAV